MESLDLSMAILSLILIVWSFGRHSSEISLMELPLLLITSLLADKLSGKSNQVLSFLFLMEWMVKVQNIVKLEFRDFCNFQMMPVMKTYL